MRKPTRTGRGTGRATAKLRQAVIGYDFGTGGVTAALYDIEANMIVAFGQGSYEHKQGLPDSRFREQDPDSWFDGMVQAMEDLRKKVDLAQYDIAAIGIGAHMHAAVFRDARGQVVQGIRNGIMWNDPCGAEEAEELAEALGQPIPARATICRALFTARRFPDIWRTQVASVRVPSADIGERLTGVLAVGRGDAAGMCGQLDQDDQIPEATLALVMKDCGIPKAFPKVVPAGTAIGRLKPDIAAVLGLKAGIPVAPPEGDQPVGMVGSGCVRLGEVSISLGNSVVLNAVAAAPVLGHRGLVDSFQTAVDKRHLLMVCVTNGCSSYDAVVNLFKPLWADPDVDTLRAMLAKLAAATPPGADGLTLVPLLGPEGIFLETDPAGTLSCIRYGNFTPGALMRALLEAEALMMKAGFEKMGIPKPNRIVVSGGGSKDPLWPQIIADVFGAPVMKPTNADEAASLGAAYLGLFVHLQATNSKLTLEDVVGPRVDTREIFHPDHEVTELYRAKLASFLRVLETNRPLYRV